MKEKTSPWFKILALCTAIGLGGVYVWRQQQKAAPQIDKPDDRTVLSGSKSKVIAPAPLPVEQEQINRVLMSSSKSGIFKPEIEQGRTLMPGSKGGLIELNPEDQKDRVLLPSTKSIPMPIFRERRNTPEEQPQPVKP
jgi:hypothetical protein